MIYKMPMHIQYSEDVSYLEYCSIMEGSINEWKNNFKKLIVY